MIGKDNAGSLLICLDISSILTNVEFFNFILFYSIYFFLISKFVSKYRQYQKTTTT